MEYKSYSILKEWELEWSETDLSPAGKVILQPGDLLAIVYEAHADGTPTAYLINLYHNATVIKQFPTDSSWLDRAAKAGILVLLDTIVN